MIPRYPGGKKNLARQVLARFPDPLMQVGQSYTEPFLGGGGLLPSMPSETAFKTMRLNDMDRGVIGVYEAIKEDPSELTSRLAEITPTVERWRESKDRDGMGNTWERAINKVILHACSHGGMGFKAGGPQGGIEQGGQYKIDCRWNPERWGKTWANIARGADVWELSSVDFEELEPDPIGFCYADPPYWKAGQGLYRHSFSDKDHCRLREWLDGFGSWVASYDDCEFIRNLYAGCRIETVAAPATNNPNKTLNELLICPNHFI